MRALKDTKVKIAHTSRKKLQVYNSIQDYSDTRNINIVEPITEISPRLTNKK